MKSETEKKFDAAIKKILRDKWLSINELGKLSLVEISRQTEIGENALRWYFSKANKTGSMNVYNTMLLMNILGIPSLSYKQVRLSI